jgi:hypothetical protein
MTEAIELGNGGHRVLLVRFDDRLVLHARPIFRERPRRIVEVCLDGTLVIPGRRGDRRGRVESRFGIAAITDRILFSDPREAEVASLWLPWIAPEDRQELARRFGDLIDPLPPEPAESAETGRTEPLGPWSSGLGRFPPRRGFRPAWVPYPGLARLRQ